MSKVPARPASVPPEAVFSEDVESWEVGERAADGRRRGLCTFYRPDGRLYLRGAFEAGVQHGPFSMFHPDGSLAREGSYARGELDGDLTAYASDNHTTLPLRGCCVPETARKLRATYRDGQLVREAFFDAEDRALSSQGKRLPERPASLPPDASFDDLAWRWVVRIPANPGSHVDRYLTPEGALCEELEYSEGVKVARRLFDAAGTLREWNGFDAEGRLHGPALTRVPDDRPNPHADARVRAERGAFEHGHPVGLRELLDERGDVLRAIDLGGPWPTEEASWSPALSDDEADAGALWEAAAALRASSRTREALCVAARAAVRTGGREGADRLRAFVAEATLRLTPEAADQRGEALSNDSEVSFVAALDELLTGAEPAAAFRTLAAVLERAPRLAHDLIEAALLLRPDGPMYRFTRGLLRLELGDDAGALADADALEHEAPDGAQFVRDSVRVLFPGDVFFPAHQTLRPRTEETPELDIAQSL
ncbi:MAG TPA: hypothetical protein VHU40_03220, partial [Polyangia bacterium]|nr:hypothetical protein [Polyangia bacterium]